jgi:hypothetical protein
VDQPTFPYKIQIDYPSGASLEDRFALDVQAVEKQIKPIITLWISFPQAWAVFSALQLASRHQSWAGPSRWLAESFARKLESMITPTEAMQEVARQGWNPQFDTPIGGKRRCRVCGCTDQTPCIEKTGGPCRWVEGDLCSACMIDPLTGKVGPE